MAKKKKYQKYEPSIKAAISATGRLGLFPELKIPRTTAQYWAGKKLEFDEPLVESMSQTLIELQDSQRQLHNEITEQKALLGLLKNTYEILGFNLRWRHVDAGAADRAHEVTGTSWRTLSRDLARG